MPAVASTSGLLHCELVRILFLETHLETRFLTVSGVHLAQTNHDMFRFHYTVFYSQLKSKVDNILAKAAALRINLKIDGGVIRELRRGTKRKERFESVRGECAILKL